jgi:hypothetical protein
MSNAPSGVLSFDISGNIRLEDLIGRDSCRLEALSVQRNPGVRGYRATYSVFGIGFMDTGISVFLTLDPSDGCGLE